MASQAITNYSEPAAPTRLQLEVGAAYGVPPNDVRAALMSAVADSSQVLEVPAPNALLVDFGASAVTYRVSFWINDFDRDEQAKDSVRTRIYYEFRRRGIEIPWPVQVQYDRTEPPADPPGRRAEFAEAISRVPVLSRLSADAHRALASSARELLFAGGEVIVRESGPGDSMFIVLSGSVAVTVGADRRQVAVTDAGGYFGEMSLLTGEPRRATVLARGDVTVLEITTGTFRAFLQTHPEVLDELVLAAGARRRELDGVRALADGSQAVAASSLRSRMRDFFGLA